MTMSAKHTPGPWDFQRQDVEHQFIPPTALFTVGERSDPAFVRERDSGFGAMMHIIAQVPVSEANARLIAAAPDLLAACIRAERELVRLSKELGDWDSSEQKTLDDLRAAVAKATGVTPQEMAEAVLCASEREDAVPAIDDVLVERRREGDGGEHAD